MHTLLVHEWRRRRRRRRLAIERGLMNRLLNDENWLRREERAAVPSSFLPRRFSSFLATVRFFFSRCGQDSREVTPPR